MFSSVVHRYDTELAFNSSVLYIAELDRAVIIIFCHQYVNDGELF